MANKEIKKSDELTAVFIAKDLCQQFFNELTTAIKNSIQNFRGEITSSAWDLAMDPTNHLARQSMDYYSGKRDAFYELSDRIKKEYGLATQILSYDTNKAYEMCEKIRHQKNEDVERIFPENNFRGRSTYIKVHRIKGQLADLLEAYGNYAFELGRKYEKHGLAKEDIEEYNPQELAKLCVESFIPEEYQNL
ncbi:MAG: hypothetical protein J6X18_12280 [Bacteroidales bacterium]|nr:hypothetical protein [Bacteroidales bacterium]